MDNKKLVITTPKGEVFTIKSKNGTVQAQLVWNEDFGREWTSKYQSAQEKLDMEIMRLMEPYMQMDTGAMIMSMRLATQPGSGKIRVNTPYGRKVYYSKSSVGRTTGALRGPYYFHRMKTDNKDYLRNFAAQNVGAK
ncbi:MAG: hypothetical protein ACK5JF_03835 [Oscillospiraceae bacterium]